MRSLKGGILLAVLALALGAPGAGAAERAQLPDFSLDKVKVSALPMLPDCHIPEVPLPTDTGYYSAAGLRLYSSISVVVDGAAGRVEIELPGAAPGEGGGAYRSSLFIKLAERDAAPELSWAAVVCVGGQYMGYKGASVALPGKAGEFSVRDHNYALGPVKGLLGRTHPWLTSGTGGDLNRLCSPDFAGRLKAYTVSALPAAAGGFSIKLNSSRKKLTVTWDKARR